MAWGLTGVGTAALAVLLTAVGLPSPLLFGSLLAGLVVAVLLPAPADRALDLPGPAVTLAQAVIGVLVGLLVDPATLRELASAWAPVLGCVLVTLLLSLLAGILLGRHPDVDPVTGSFALVAGGASGLTAIAGGLGADARLVAVVQYLRVLLIILLMPVVALALPHGSAPAPVVTTSAPWWLGLLVTAGCVLGGLGLTRLLRLPAGSLLVPMTLAGLVGGSGLVAGAAVPDPLVQAAYAVVGASVGLTFTRASLAAVGRALPVALLLVIALLVVTALIGIPLLGLAGASVLDAYLATTPGGLVAVLATAVDTGADTTLVLTVQVVRLVVMLALAPGVALAVGRRRPRP